MYQVTGPNGFVVECETVEEVRALMGENPKSTRTVGRVRRGRKPGRKQRNPAKMSMGTGPKRKWAVAAWYAEKEKTTKNAAWLTLGLLRKDDPTAYAKIEQAYDKAMAKSG